jgi:predicted signal transduction protein with EAL and GGDEF domain
MDRTLLSPLADSPAAGAPRRARVVLASADPTAEAALRRALSRDPNGALAVVESAEAAIAEIEAGRLDLLLLDLDQGSADALGLLSRLRADPRWQFLPVIVLSGADEGPERLAALEHGATEILAKPIDPIELELRLRNTLALKAHQDRLQQLDPITGLANRDEFLRRVDALLVETSTVSDGGTSTVAIDDASTDPGLVPRTLVRLDLDRFRAVLDAVGHDASDQLLAAVGQRISDVLLECGGGHSRRANDPTSTPWVARMNRDTFLALLPGSSGDPRVDQCLAALRTALRRPFEVDDGEVVLSPTIGIAHFPEHGLVATDLVHRAGLAVRQARRDVGAGTAVYTASIGVQAQERLTVEQELRRAIERDEFRVHYQPKHDVRTLAIVGAEALVRWAHPQRGLLQPSKFIELAEESGLVAAIGRRVLEQGCRQLVEWDAVLAERSGAGLRGGSGDGVGEEGPLRMAINLSALQFGLGDIAPAVAAILRDTGLAGSRVTLELTETLLIDEGQDAVAQLRALKALGVELSLDDFGTGYSSLAYLRSFPLDEVKIDRSFVRDLGCDRRARAIVGAIIALGRELGLRVVAEGVETEAQLAVLRELGCHQFQGYLLDGEPVEGAELGARLQAARARTSASRSPTSL